MEKIKFSGLEIHPSIIDPDIKPGRDWTVHISDYDPAKFDERDMRKWMDSHLTGGRTVHQSYEHVNGRVVYKMVFSFEELDDAVMFKLAYEML